jgi:hypothetical protein
MAISQTNQNTARVGGLPRWSGAVLGLGVAAAWVIFSGVGVSAATTVNLGRATPFAVLASTSVTNTGATTIYGDLGVYAGTSVTGTPPAIVEPPSTIHAGDPVALGAQNDLTTAYTQAAGEGPPTTVGSNLGGDNLTAGVYQSSSDGALSVTGTLTLTGNSSSVFIFQTGASYGLTTATGSTVILAGGASACNVFWQIGSSAVLNGPTFVGTVMASTSITVGNGVLVDGRLLASTGDVTLINDNINASACIPTSTPTPTPGTGVPVTGAGGTSHFGDGILLGLGGLAVLGAGAAVGTIRRRRFTSVR